MRLELDKGIYITSMPELFPNVPKDEDLRKTHKMGVIIHAISIDDFESKGDEKQTKEAYLKYLAFKGADKRYDYPKYTAVSTVLNLFQIAYCKAHYRKAFDEDYKKIW